MYYRPSYNDRNVIPYRPMILLMCNAHKNIQKVTNTKWTWYLLKYVNKVEPKGRLDLGDESDGMTTEQVKCASSLFFSKPISVTKVVTSRKHHYKV